MLLIINFKYIFSQEKEGRGKRLGRAQIEMNPVKTLFLYLNYL